MRTARLVRSCGRRSAFSTSLQSAQRTSCNSPLLRHPPFPPAPSLGSRELYSFDSLRVSLSSLCFFPLAILFVCVLVGLDSNRGESSPLARPRTGVLERACRSATTTPGTPQGICALPMIARIRSLSMVFQNLSPVPGRLSYAHRLRPTGLSRVI